MLDFSLHPPVLIVGPPRSGTTWLSHAFEKTSELAMIREPRQIWEWGHWFRPHDHLIESDATPLVKKHITKRFQKLTAKEGKSRFCDKTPSNSLRIRFIHSIFPDGRFIFIYRDGRAVIRSTGEIKRLNMTWKNYAKRIRLRLSQSSPTDMIGVVSRMPFLIAKLTGKPIKKWGTRPPGWRQWQCIEDNHLLMARQWAATTQIALDDMEHIPAQQILKVSYEDIVRNPRPYMERIVDFAGLQCREPVIQYMEDTSDPSCLDKWKNEIDAETLSSVWPEMEAAMKRLNMSQ